LKPFLVGFLRIASLYFIFLIFILKKSEFWGITKNWVMTICLENEGKIQLEKKEETTSTKMTMISFGSIDHIPLPSLLCKMKVIFDANDSSNHLSQEALHVQFEVDLTNKIV
jgi:hypothetical protein